ncbi:uncharacterized protein TRIADDRAFT_59566 [Trichoplax adhaerens]|uniref:G-protein coupled receptors family 3 profile domain-containing protein n=1 Tax=Trichoplax adhaerens TaxID=10228 RepID=B3S605_TRIAD|nr:hypothetical protein TRIADDRAFT_59566 [Trichoplax adhaerens]EDV22010.1 hypothetical protein TRIADDRAFT_59566 [Trichoplax adhaerens]|eukprot:XP_002115647.1 hypothetical protein TRIADDRAFT_59566 [Trichoplax adhaerens]
MGYAITPVCNAYQYRKNPQFARKAGIMQIQGVFPNTLQYDLNTNLCSAFSLENLQLTQAMIYTMNQLINGNPNLLPGIELGYTIMDSCSSRFAASVSLTSSLVTSDKEIFSYATCQIPNSNHILTNFVTSLENNTNIRNPTIGIVAEKSESLTLALASYTSSLNLPQISYNSFTNSLQNRNLYPYFFRTTSTVQLQTKAIFDLISYFHWNWITVIIAGNEAVTNIKQILTTNARNRDICISTIITLNENYTQSALYRAVRNLKQRHQSNVIILIGDENIVFDFLKVAEAQKLSGKTFIGSYTWLKSLRLSNISGDILGGALGLDIPGETYKKFLNYLQNLDLCNNVDNPWFIQAWFEKLTLAGYNAEQVIKNCKINRRLQLSLFDKFYDANYISEFTMDAVLALAYALHDRLGCNSHSCPPFDPDMIAKDHGQFKNYLHKVSFPGITSRRFVFRPDGSSQLPYDIVTLHPFKNATTNTVRKIKIGSWSLKNDLIIDSKKIRWNGGNNWSEIPSARCSEDCQPGHYLELPRDMASSRYPCCWKCRKCKPQAISDAINQIRCIKCVNYTQPNDNHTECVDMQIARIKWDGAFAIAMYILTSFYLVALIFIWVTIILYRKTPVVKGSNYLLLNIYLCFNLLILVSAFLYLIPVTKMACTVQMVMISASEIGILVTIISKTNQIDMIFKNTSRGGGIRSKLIRNSSQILFILVTEVISQAIVLGLLAYSPASIVRTINDDNHIELMCGFSNSPSIIAFAVIILLLSFTALTLAFRTRSLPDNFSEARYIFLASLMVTTVAVSSVPTLLLTTAENNTRQQAVASVANFTFNNNRPSPKPISLNSNNSYLTDSPIAVGRKVLTARIQPKNYSEETDQEDL